MADQIEEIKSKIDIVDLIKEYLQLTVAGAHFKARCPFHQEKSPSFMVSPTRQTFHCFGCGVGGDIFTFFQKQEGAEFPEALRVLAERAGVTLERTDPRTQDEKNRFLSLVELASQYYHQALLRSQKAEGARAYLQSRGIDASAIDEWRIGYALPDSDALANFLLSKKYTANELIAVGLAMKKDRGYGLFDRFKNRIMIPIRNVHGGVIGFGGRILADASEGAGPKYINSPQTMLYDKGRTVFGLDRAKTDIRKSDRAILVEGYMDCFAVAKSGMRNVVATSGTALTLDQIRLIKRFTPHFYFSLDADAAGSQATMRGIELALKEGVDARVILLPREQSGMPLYKDPDECIAKDPSAWTAAVEGAVSFVEYCFLQTITERARKDSFEKKKASRALLDIIALLPDRIEQDHWIKRLGADLSLSEQILWEELQKETVARASIPPVRDVPITTQYNHGLTHADTLLALLIEMPHAIEQLASIVSPEMFESPDSSELYRTIQGLYAAHKEGEDFLMLLKKDAPAMLLESYAFLIERDFAGEDARSKERTLFELAKNIATSAVKKKMRELQQNMHSAEAAHDNALLQHYADDFGALQSRLHGLNSN